MSKPDVLKVKSESDKLKPNVLKAEPIIIKESPSSARPTTPSDLYVPTTFSYIASSVATPSSRIQRSIEVSVFIQSSTILCLTFRYTPKKIQPQFQDEQRSYKTSYIGSDYTYVADSGFATDAGYVTMPVSETTEYKRSSENTSQGSRDKFNEVDSGYTSDYKGKSGWRFLCC